jgi:phosphoribosylformylglycinamidine (FGAM) synthase-like amidotransferase family enzyme
MRAHSIRREQESCFYDAFVVFIFCTPKMATSELKLVDILPKNFTYNFECALFQNEENYSFKCRVLEVKNEADFQLWLQGFKAQSATDWIVSKSDFKPQTQYARFAFGKDYVCQLKFVNNNGSISTKNAIFNGFSK